MRSLLIIVTSFLVASPALGQQQRTPSTPEQDEAAKKDTAKPANPFRVDKSPSTKPDRRNKNRRESGADTDRGMRGKGDPPQRQEPARGAQTQ